MITVKATLEISYLNIDNLQWTEGKRKYPECLHSIFLAARITFDTSLFFWPIFVFPHTPGDLKI